MRISRETDIKLDDEFPQTGFEENFFLTKLLTLLTATLNGEALYK